VKARGSDDAVDWEGGTRGRGGNGDAVDWGGGARGRGGQRCKKGLVGSRDGVRRKRNVEGEDERSGEDLTVRTVCEGDARAEQKADAGADTWRGRQRRGERRIMFLSYFHTF
jgi:hypothetical protein